MEISILSLLVIGFVSLLYLAYTSMRKPKNFPPGPVGIPFLGSMHYLTHIPSTGMDKMTKKYGNVFSVKLFHVNVVCVNGYDAIKELFFKKANVICDRPTTMTSFVKGNPMAGITEGKYGPSWAANRRIFHQTIRELGANGVENIIQKEVAFMIQELEHLSDNKLVDPSDVVAIGILNIVAAIVFGNRFDYNDKKMIKLLDLNNEAFRRYEMSDWTVHLVTVYPQLTKIWFPKAVKEFIRVEKSLYDFFEEEIEERKREFDPHSPRDYIDYYLNKLNDQPGKNQTYSEHQLRIALLDLFQAGSETTATTIRWALLYLAGNQDMQKRIHKEIDEVIAFDVPKYDHRLKMSYTEAFFHEVSRMSKVLPAGLLRTAIEDTELAGYNIPKGTWVWPNLRSSSLDADHWKNPREFDPENFLNENGKFVLRDGLAAFGGGIRICLGMAIAKQEIFLFLVSLMQRFVILPEIDVMEIDFVEVPGLSMTPKPYKIRLVERS